MPLIAKQQRYLQTPRRNQTQIIFWIAVALGLAVIVLSILLAVGTTSDTSLRDNLLEHARQEDRLAREYAARISRTGGTGTVHAIAMTRQHLHGLELLNDMAEQLLLQKEIVPAEAISRAYTALDEAETLVLGAGTIDAQIADLWEQLGIITQVLLATET